MCMIHVVNRSGTGLCGMVNFERLSVLLLFGKV